MRRIEASVARVPPRGSAFLGVATAGAQLAPLPLRPRAPSAWASRCAGWASPARVLYVTAHPDDENNAVLVRLSRGEGVRTALLTLTRGEGGQNAIGPELFEALGVLRTEELTAVHRYDGVEQYFGRAYEFGYSFSVEESFAKWGREETLGDVVRVVRAFRPGRDADACRSKRRAADSTTRRPRSSRARRSAPRPTRGAFPSRSRRACGPGRRARSTAAASAAATTRRTRHARPASRPPCFDPLLGMTWTELGGLARRSHRSQDQGAGPGPRTAPPCRYVLLDSEPALPASHGPAVDGVDAYAAGPRCASCRSRDAGGGLAAALASERRSARQGAGRLRRARSRSGPRRRCGPPAHPARAAERRCPAGAPSRADGVVDRLADEQRDVERALALALGVRLEAQARDDAVVPGQRFEVEVTVRNEGREPAARRRRWRSTCRTDGARSRTRPRRARRWPPGAGAPATFDVTVAADARCLAALLAQAPDRDRLLVDRPRGRDAALEPARGGRAMREWGADGTVTSTSRRSASAAPVAGRREAEGARRRAGALACACRPRVAVVPLGRRAPRAFRVVGHGQLEGGRAARRCG